MKNDGRRHGRVANAINEQRAPVAVDAETDALLSYKSRLEAELRYVESQLISRANVATA